MKNLFQILDGRCPYCGNIVNIVEGMVYDYTLDIHGNPYRLNSEQYKVAAYCKRCEKCLYVAPNEAGGYTVYPDNPAIPAMLHALYNSSDVPKRSSALGIRLLEREDNPFVNLTDDNDCPF